MKLYLTHPSYVMSRYCKKKTAKFDPIHSNMLVNRILERKKKHWLHLSSYENESMKDTKIHYLFWILHGVTLDKVKEKHVGRSNHLITIEIGPAQGKALIICWLLRTSQKSQDRNMDFNLIPN